MKRGDLLVRKSTVWHRGMPNNSTTPRPMMSLTFGEKSAPEGDPFTVHDGKMFFYPNWFNTSRLGRIRERVFVAAPLTYSAYRFLTVVARKQRVFVVLVIAARWRPGIGDPTFLGWLTVAAYAAAALYAARCFAQAARRAELRFHAQDPEIARDQRAMKHLWLLISLTMVLLGLNKQLDLQTLLIQTVRDRAYEQGWYNDRRKYQVDFILVMTAAAVIFGIGMSLRLRRVLRRVFVAIAGMGMLVLFVLVRASSFHYVDRALSLGGRYRLSAIIELSGIALIIGAALHWQVDEQRRVEHDVSSAATVSASTAPSSSMV